MRERAKREGGWGERRRPWGRGGSGGGVGVRQMTQVMKWPSCCAGSSHVRLCSLPLSGHYPSPERPAAPYSLTQNRYEQVEQKVGGQELWMRGGVAGRGGVWRRTGGGKRGEKRNRKGKKEKRRENRELKEEKRREEKKEGEEGKRKMR